MRVEAMRKLCGGSMKCACSGCMVENPLALTFDHIHNDPKTDFDLALKWLGRKYKAGGSGRIGTGVQAKLILAMPEPSLRWRVLCYICNMARQFKGGTERKCPMEGHPHS